MHPEALAALVFWYPAFLFSTCAHEAAHAWAAERLGDSTAADEGQVSLSALPHMSREPIGMLVVPLLTAITHGWPMAGRARPTIPTGRRGTRGGRHGWRRPGRPQTSCSRSWRSPS